MRKLYLLLMGVLFSSGGVLAQTNLTQADGVSAKASSTSAENNGNYTADKAIDGKKVNDDNSSKWASDYSNAETKNDQWFYVDLGSKQTVNTIKLYTDNQAPQKFEIYLTDNITDVDNPDLSNLTAVNVTKGNKNDDGTLKANDNSENTYVFDNTEAQYAIIKFIQAGSWGYGIYEFEIYNIDYNNTNLDKVTSSISFMPVNTTQDITFTLFNNAGVSFEDGEVTYSVDKGTLSGNQLTSPEEAGAITITATQGDKTATCVVYAVNAPTTVIEDNVAKWLYPAEGTVWNPTWGGGQSTMGTEFTIGEKKIMPVVFSKAVFCGAEWNLTNTGYESVKADVYVTKDCTMTLNINESRGEGDTYPAANQTETFTAGEWKTITLPLDGKNIRTVALISDTEDKQDILLTSIYLTKDNDETVPTWTEGYPKVNTFNKTSVTLDLLATDDVETKTITYTVTIQNDESEVPYKKTTTAKSGEATTILLDGLTTDQEYTFVVTASDGKNVTVEKTITATPKAVDPVLTTLTLTAGKNFAKVGDAVELTLAGKDQEDADFALDNNNVTYVITPEAIGSVAEGKFTATTFGEATIKAVYKVSDDKNVESEPVTITIIDANIPTVPTNIAKTIYPAEDTQWGPVYNGAAIAGEEIDLDGQKLKPFTEFANVFFGNGTDWNSQEIKPTTDNKDYDWINVNVFVAEAQTMRIVTEGSASDKSFELEAGWNTIEAPIYTLETINNMSIRSANENTKYNILVSGIYITKDVTAPVFAENYPTVVAGENDATLTVKATDNIAENDITYTVKIKDATDGKSWTATAKSGEEATVKVDELTAGNTYTFLVTASDGANESAAKEVSATTVKLVLTTLGLTADNDLAKVGEGVNLTLTAKDQNDTDFNLEGSNVVYTVSPSDAGKVENGVFTAEKAGTATITVSVEGSDVTAQTTISVYDAAKKVEVTANQITIDADVNPNDIANAFDGNLETKWQMLPDNKGDLEEGFTIDLRGIYSIDAISVAFKDACSTSYDVELLDAAKNVVATKTVSDIALTDGAAENTIGISGTGVRYVKYTSKGSSNAAWGVHISEFTVYYGEKTADVGTELAKIDLKVENNKTLYKAGANEEIVITTEATGTDDRAYEVAKYTYMTSDANVVAIEEGKFITKAAGTAIIYVTAKASETSTLDVESNKINISVEEPKPAKLTVALEGNTTGVKIGEKANIVTTLKDQFGEDITAEVTYTVDANGSVDANGVFTAGTAMGTATITAKADEAEATLAVTVYEGDLHKNDVAPEYISGYVAPAEGTLTDGNEAEPNSIMANAFDGNEETRWVLMGQEGTPEKAVGFKYDLLGAYNIKAVSINFEGANSYEYTINLYDKNNTLIKSKDFTFENKARTDFLTSFDADPATARKKAATRAAGDDAKVRYVEFVNKKASEWGVKIFEFNVYVDETSKEEVEITPTLTSISLTAADATYVIKAGDTVELTATGKDQLGKDVENVEVTLSCTEGKGSFKGNTFTAAGVGEVEITAKSGELVSNTLKFFIVADNAIAVNAGKVTADESIVTDGIANAFDGNVETQWNLVAENNDGEKGFTIDLEDLCDISTLAVVFEGACSKSYKVEFIGDDKTTVIKTVSHENIEGGNGLTPTVYDEVSAEKVRFVKFTNIEAFNAAWGVHIKEFTVYGKMAPGQTPRVKEIEVAVTNVEGKVKTGKEIETTITAKDQYGEAFTGEITPTYTSSNPDVIAVVDGKLVAKAAGDATITVTVNGVSVEKTITVEDAKPVSLAVTADKTSVKVSEKITLTVDAKDQFGDSMSDKVQYTVENALGVIENNVFTAATAGTGNIIAHIDGVENDVKIAITVTAADNQIKLSADYVTVDADVNPNDIANAFDGDASTKWQMLPDQKGALEESFTVDLRGIYNVAAYSVSFTDACSTTYTVELLNADKQIVATKTVEGIALEAGKAVSIKDLAGTDVRYVKFTSKGSSTPDWGVHITEFAVFGTKTADIPAEVTTVEVTVDEKVKTGSDINVEITAKDQNGNDFTGETTVTYESSNTDVIEVVDGKLVANAAGDATITVTVNGVSVEKTITVEDAKATKLSVTPDKTSVKVGETINLTVKVLDQFGDEMDSTVEVAYTVENGLGTVENNIFTAIAEGTGNIIARAEGCEDVMIEITVEPATAINGIHADGSVDEDTVVYNLRGQRINRVTKGSIVIINGKKVAIK